jgi:hypothetical protein
MDEITPGLCQCGCGQRTGIAKQNDRRFGWVKGEPVRFVPGHQSRGARHHDWKGDAAGYMGLHTWLGRHYPKTGICEECGKPSKRTEYALTHGREHSRNRDDYRELCTRCHVLYDRGGVKLCPATIAKIGKLTEDAVREIRHQRRQGASLKSLAEIYGVSRPAISEAANGKTWTHVRDTA